MGSVVSRNIQRENKKEVDGANTRAIFFGCFGMCYESPVGDSSQTSLMSAVSSDNIGTSSIIISLSEILQSSSNAFSSGTWQSFEPTPLTQVLPQLYLGSEVDAHQAEKLIGLGITHVISMVGSGRYEDFYPNHMYILLRDNGSSDLLEKLQNSYDFTMESQKKDKKLFVHCLLGQNRSASFVIGLLMKWRNLSFHEAYSFLKKKRELIHPTKKYIEQLRQLDLQLHKVHSTPENFLDIAVDSKEEIVIANEKFSKADSEAFKRAQMHSLKQDGEYSQSSPESICLPDFHDSWSRLEQIDSAIDHTINHSVQRAANF